MTSCFPNSFYFHFTVCVVLLLFKKAFPPIRVSRPIVEPLSTIIICNFSVTYRFIPLQQPYHYIQLKHLCQTFSCIFQYFSISTRPCVSFLQKTHFFDHFRVFFTHFKQNFFIFPISTKKFQPAYDWNPFPIFI